MGDIFSSPFLWLGIMMVLLVVLTMLRTQKSKQMQAQHISFIESIKAGDKVRTHIGVYGKVLSITETTDGKVFLLEIGEKRKSEIEVDYRVIAGPDNKETLQFDAQGNIIAPQPKTSQDLYSPQTEVKAEEEKQTKKTTKK